MSVLTKAGIFASFERETLRKGSPRARWGFGAMLQREVSDVVTDSRKAGPGSLFGAIQGERVDGHRFIAQVFDQGAVCVLSERDLTKEELISDAAIQAAQAVETGVSQMSEWKENPKEARRERFVKSIQGNPEDETGLLHIEVETPSAGAGKTAAVPDEAGNPAMAIAGAEKTAAVRRSCLQDWTAPQAALASRRTGQFRDSGSRLRTRRKRSGRLRRSI